MADQKSPEADIGMIFEGSYPYVSGGVSAWAQQLIESLPEFTFTVIAILPDRKPRKLKYKLPKNIVNLHHIFIFEEEKHYKTFGRSGWRKTIEEFHLQSGQSNSQFFTHVAELFGGSAPPKLEDLINSKGSFEMVSRLYSKNAPDASFLDYFWTWRFMHLGMFRIMKAPLFNCRLYHSISTGYSGMYGSRSRIFHKRPYFLTEHGIYTMERKIEIARSDWIYDKKKEEIRPERTLGIFKNMWIRAFRTMSRITYEFADEIITLYPRNQTWQIKDGAQKNKLRVIYNGIDFDHYHAYSKERLPSRFNIVLIGRVVAIKDIKTFIRCVKILSNHIPELKAFIIGPTEEEPKYYQECLQLVNLFGIKDIIEFTGKVDVVEYYHRMDVLLLTSISEAQPLVILEANAAGIPVVCSNVGDCRELLYGRPGPDREIGQSGFVFSMANPEQAANQVTTLHKDLKLYKRFSQAGIKRTGMFYKKEYQIDSYRKLYNSYLQEKT
ncbi:MAG: GT4 family glycosyltransferase PelF [bacterium]